MRLLRPTEYTPKDDQKITEPSFFVTGRKLVAGLAVIEPSLGGSTIGREGVRGWRERGENGVSVGRWVVLRWEGTPKMADIRPNRDIWGGGIIAGERSFPCSGAKRFLEAFLETAAELSGGVACGSVGVEDQDPVVEEDLPWPPRVGLVESVDFAFRIVDRDPLVL